MTTSNIEQTGEMVSASTMKSFVCQLGLYSYFKNSSKDLQMATYDEMTTGGGEFNFINGHPKNVSGLMDGMITAEVDASIKVKLGDLKALCVAESNPEPEAQPEPKGVSAKRVQWNQGRDICVCLNQPLPEPTSVTTWLVKDGFKDENLGRSVRVDEALKYVIRMDGKRVAGTVEVRVADSTADFTVEAI